MIFDIHVYNIIKRTKLTCIALDAFLVVPLTKRRFFQLKNSFLLFFTKLKNTKHHLFVSGTARNAHKAMHISFVLIKISLKGVSVGLVVAPQQVTNKG
jgi:hypothetical protein